MSETRPCKRCGGTGKDQSEHRRGQDCLWCYGAGLVPGPVIGEIVKAVTRGLPNGKRAFRKSRPPERRSLEAARAYYVWRLARFHGGADVSMPVVASMINGYDPWLRELDQIAEAVAKQVFGTDMAAAHRWGRALGYLDKDVPGLPESAYAGGPVVTSGEKPPEETPELEG